MRKWISAIALLCLLVTGLISSTPTTPAQATTSWPIKLENTPVTSVAGYDNGTFSAIACNEGVPSAVSVAYFDNEGKKRSTLAGPTTTQTYCGSDGSQTFSDGTVYTMNRLSGGVSELAAWKNGRQIWATTTTSSVTCNPYGSTFDGKMTPNSISEGDDGNVYMILTPGYLPASCDDRLFAVNKDTGAILIDQTIGNGPSTGSGLGSADPKVWTYDGKLVVVDRDAVIREFSYAGVENTSAQYQFPIPSGHTIRQVLANNSGTLFAITSAVWTSGYATLLYHKDNGDSGSIVDNYAPNNVNRFYLTGDGSAVAVAGSTQHFDRFDLSTDTVSSSNISNTSGYMYGGIIGYVEDEYGKALVLWSYSDSTGTHQALSLDLITVGTSSKTNLFFEATDGTDPAGPNLYNYATAIDNSIADASLYIPVCRATASTCFGSGVPDIWIYKADLTGFGAPLRNDFKRNNYASDKLEYVAMGDSFASGEGNPYFDTWTDRSGINQCHRSLTGAYPKLLAADEDLNLNLTFVACSGATTDTLINSQTGSGSWLEPAQIDAVSTSTDIITLTIGGNDAGFVEFMTNCLTPGSNCDETTDIYTETEDFITNDLYGLLSNIYTEIANRIGPNTKVLVVGYPLLISDESGSAYSNCYLLSNDEKTAAEGLSNLMNLKLISSVAGFSDSRFSAVSAMDTGSPFEGHDTCATDNYIREFNLLDPRVYTAHPNSDGQQAYYEIISDFIKNM